MANHTKQQQSELRAAVQAAVDQDIITPTEILEYLEDNAFEPLPTRPTIIAILEACNVVFIAGGWMKIEDDDE